MEEVGKLFRQAHLERYHVDMTRPTEFVNLRVAVHGLLEKQRITDVLGDASQREVRTRSVAFGGEWREVGIYDREKLAPGASSDGPAIIEESGSTTVVVPGYSVEVHVSGALVLVAKSTEV